METLALSKWAIPFIFKTLLVKPQIYLGLVKNRATGASTTDKDIGRLKEEFIISIL